MKDGNILLSVHAEDSEEIKRAKEIFSNAQAADICITGVETAPYRKEKAANYDELKEAI